MKEKKESTEAYKLAILYMAGKGELKPSCKRALGFPLKNYTSPSSISYDEEFTRTLKKLRPDWFVTGEEKEKAEKELIIEIAKSDSLTLGGLKGCLKRYCSEPSVKYDDKFTATLKELRPEWFGTGHPQRPIIQKNYDGENSIKCPVCGQEILRESCSEDPLNPCEHILYWLDEAQDAVLHTSGRFTKLYKEYELDVLMDEVMKDDKESVLYRIAGEYLGGGIYQSELILFSKK